MKNVNEREQLMNRAMGAAIRSRRAIRKMTVGEVAAKADIADRTMARYLNGETALNYGVLTLIAGALGTTVEQLSRDAVTISAAGELPEV